MSTLSVPYHREPGKPIATAYYSVVTMVGALGGVSAFVGPFARGGSGLILLTISLVVILVALDVVVKWVAKRLQQQVTSPANGTKIVGHSGVNIGISACGLTAGETGWLFDFDESSKTYGLDGDGGPIVTGNQNLTFNDSPVGQAGDQDEYVQIVLVLANSACNTALNGMDLTNNQPSSLPASCQIVGQVEVIETW